MKIGSSERDLAEDGKGIGSLGHEAELVDRLIPALCGQIEPACGEGVAERRDRDRGGGTARGTDRDLPGVATVERDAEPGGTGGGRKVEGESLFAVDEMIHAMIPGAEIRLLFGRRDFQMIVIRGGEECAVDGASVVAKIEAKRLAKAAEAP